MIKELDEGLLATIRGVINESEEGDAHVATKHTGLAWKKMLAMHDLMAGIHEHIGHAQSMGLGDEHHQHMENFRSAMNTVAEHLTKAQEPMSAANSISYKKAHPEED